MHIHFKDSVERQLTRQRLELAKSQLDPHELPANQMGAISFCMVCEALIESGSTSTPIMEGRIREKYGSDFCPFFLEAAMEKVQDFLDSQRKLPLIAISGQQACVHA